MSEKTEYKLLRARRLAARAIKAELTAPEASVLQCIMSFEGPDDEDPSREVAWTSQAMIAAFCRLGLATVQRACVRLENDKFIRCVRVRGTGVKAWEIVATANDGNPNDVISAEAKRIMSEKKTRDAGAYQRRTSLGPTHLRTSDASGASEERTGASVGGTGCVPATHDVSSDVSHADSLFGSPSPGVASAPTGKAKRVAMEALVEKILTAPDRDTLERAYTDLAHPRMGGASRTWRDRADAAKNARLGDLNGENPPARSEVRPKLPFRAAHASALVKRGAGTKYAHPIEEKTGKPIISKGHAMGIEKHIALYPTEASWIVLGDWIGAGGLFRTDIGPAQIASASLPQWMVQAWEWDSNGRQAVNITTFRAPPARAAAPPSSEYSAGAAANREKLMKGVRA